MRLSKILFPFILLVIFFGVIALGMAAGYWETEGGGRHRREPTIPETAVLEQAERIMVTWPL